MRHDLNKISASWELTLHNLSSVLSKAHTDPSRPWQEQVQEKVAPKSAASPTLTRMSDCIIIIITIVPQASPIPRARNEKLRKTSCARAATQYAPAPCKLTISSHLFVRWRCCSGITISSYLFAWWHLFRHIGYSRHRQQVDL